MRNRNLVAPFGLWRASIVTAVALPLGLLLAIPLTPSPAAALVTTTFNSSLEGWLVTGDNASVWSSTGGNPGGCFDVNDLATGANNLAVAPPAYLGNWSAMTSADSIRLDLFLHRINGTQVGEPYQFRISGPGGAAHTLGGYMPPQDVWATVGAPLDSTTWVIESGSWSAILAHVNTVLIQVEFISGAEEVRFDNVRLTGTVMPFFDSCVLETFNTAGLGDWSFTSTGGVSNPGSQGNGGGYCRVADGTGVSYALVPARFLGNWSPLDGSGRVTIDTRLVSSAGSVLNVPEFIRISGPGGVAHVSLAIADVSTSLLKWTRYEFPIQASAWTLDSGTWPALLADVTECRIQAELMDGTEVLGIDNFGRLAAACSDPDQTVVLQSPDFAKCSEESFVTIGGIGFNPVDNELYGLVDAASASGGGLYRVTGLGAGVRLQAYATPTQVIFDATGSAFIAEDTGGSVFRWSGGLSSVWVSGFHAGDDDPSGMCFAPPGFDGPNVDPGDILVMDPGYSGPDELWAFKTSVAESELQVIADLPGSPDFRDVTAGPSGVVYTASMNDANNIYSISASGVLTPIALSTPLSGMISLAYDLAAARLYVVETGGNTLRRINPATGAVELLASGFDSFNDGALEFDPETQSVYVADAGMHRVYRFCKTSSTAVPSAARPRAPGEITALSVAPNPARGSTRIAWSLSRAADSRVVVFDVAGRAVRRIAAGAQAAGEASRTWDGRDDSGNPVRSGVYLVRIETARDKRAAWVTLLR
ncbi:MAG: T9SS type A sorting domain-containing protein [Candidatus Eisenbacteria bacterium]|uniref:T9SS type A sorting domain-containing protein n=1 Tax=Eiseniibacteriota bacterium TaxID=2212470 RepID=A0A849SBH5_UNCEI|nr:T9SS type A sorting domain-containing protein [Candidatus Eisenbacteria bacterium]